MAKRRHSGIARTARLTYSGRFETPSKAIPAARQSADTLYNVGFAIGPGDNSWVVAFIGRNLPNVFYAASPGQVPLTGSAMVASDVFATVIRDRELLARITFRPF
jgi:hypothetical protein